MGSGLSTSPDENALRHSLVCSPLPKAESSTSVSRAWHQIAWHWCNYILYRLNISGELLVEILSIHDWNSIIPIFKHYWKFYAKLTVSSKVIFLGSSGNYNYIFRNLLDPISLKVDVLSLYMASAGDLFFFFFKISSYLI